MTIRRILSFVCLLIIVPYLYANDTLIQKSVGGNEYIIGKTNSISIESEILKIDLFNDYYSVSVDYIFRNDGESTTFEVGFPEIEYERATTEINDAQKIRDFKTSVDGVDQDIKIKQADVTIDSHVNEKITKFYAKTVVFPEKQKKNIHVEYTTSYNKNTRGMGLYYAEYLLGSAICWNKIENLKVIVNIHVNEYFLIREFDDIENNKPTSITASTCSGFRSLEQQYSNVNLQIGTKLKLIVDDDRDIFGLPWDYNFEYKLYQKTDFQLLSKDQLRLSRNLIYAYHGYEFKDKKLIERFKKYSFYTINHSFSEKMFNSFEKRNLDIIKEIESGK